MKLDRIILSIIFTCLGWAVMAQTVYHIGDVFTAPDGSQGIVYYLHPDGTGGWVVALEDASAGCAWGEGGDVPGLNNHEFDPLPVLLDTAGYTNTQTLRDFQNNNSNFAAGKVDFANGWILPSPKQLITLFSSLPFVSSAIIAAGGTDLANDVYWTSAEFTENYAWTVPFGAIGNPGGLSEEHKLSLQRVRAVYNFDYRTLNENASYQWSTGDNTASITVTPEQTTTYTVTVSMPGGCNDTVQKTIVVANTYTTEFSVFSTIPYSWNDVTYIHSGDYTMTLSSITGCDSVVTLHLTLSLSPEVTITATADTICEGESLTLQTDVTLPEPDPVFYVPQVAPGDILCTDGSIEKPASWPVAGKTAMGIVVYVDNTGEHGWALHLHEQGEMPWSTAQTGNIPNAVVHDTPLEAISDYNGSYNTWAIRQVTNTSLYPAAWAVDYDNGWYLPASGQLYLLYALIPILNESLDICGGTLLDTTSGWMLCSSSVAAARNMWSLDAYGYIIHYLPVLDYTVRSMRNF